MLFACFCMRPALPGELYEIFALPGVLYENLVITGLCMEYTLACIWCYYYDNGLEIYIQMLAQNWTAVIRISCLATLGNELLACISVLSSSSLQCCSPPPPPPRSGGYYPMSCPNYCSVYAIERQKIEDLRVCHELRSGAHGGGRV